MCYCNNNVNDLWINNICNNLKLIYATNWSWAAVLSGSREKWMAIAMFWMENFGVYSFMLPTLSLTILLLHTYQARSTLSFCCLKIPQYGNTGLGIGELDRAVCTLCSNEIAPSTASSYWTGVSRYMNFCSSYRLPPSRYLNLLSVVLLHFSSSLVSDICRLDYSNPSFVIVSYVMVDQIPLSTPFSYTTFYEEPGEVFRLTFDLDAYWLCQPFYAYYIIAGRRVQSVLKLFACGQCAVWDYLASFGVTNLLVNLFLLTTLLCYPLVTFKWTASPTPLYCRSHYDKAKQTHLGLE